MKIKVYAVQADRETGEWLGSPEATGESVELSKWHAREDTDNCHHDTYEHFEEGDSVHSETRAIRVKWA